MYGANADFSYMMDDIQIHAYAMHASCSFDITWYFKDLLRSQAQKL